ncbi:GAF domain-containing sensor histidine kinase [Asanoa sp. WMMD1127]|uniref:GAF domain-containing sensor histidine kinase n=1 Tax=Asanoa sp. WMMD1127 TaxID=3016107 RepID=UPI002416BCFC|nr:GAF domain-containing sensor histidine kinase [Asanoa sp. WMMD1127]MDG4821785.1 GAF domain-containing sensor histidine kinase [Asanoa sp. WMMD1127]
MDAREELRALSAAVLAVTARRSVHEVLQTIVSSARRLLNARYAALGVPDADSGSFAEFVVDGISDAQWRLIGPLPRQHGLLAVMLRDPAPLRLSDIRAHPRFEYWPKHHPELRDFLGMPIVHGEEILGALYLANKRDGEFGQEDEDLLRILAGHAAIALVNARLYERSRELSVLEERDRIARELHDSVAQKLFGLRLTADAAAALVARDPDGAEAQLRTVRALAAEAADELRSIVVGMRPADLAAEGLDAALRKQVRLLDRVHAARVRLRVRSAVPRLAPDREDAAYRVAQEALHNALRHADARTVEVRLFVDGAFLVVEVCDDGVGLRPADQSSLGLASMRDRASSVGGALRVVSDAGKGTTVRLEVPVG